MWKCFNSFKEKGKIYRYDDIIDDKEHQGLSDKNRKWFAKIKELTKAEQGLIDIANDGQSDEKKYKAEAFTRFFAGRVKDVAKLRNPLGLGSLVFEVDKYIEMINPELTPEIEWLKKLQTAIKLFHNEIIIANRLLGIKNDNEYDIRVFEKLVREHFFMQLSDKKVTPNTPISTDFKTMVEMVELGVRHFGR